jgi:catechol 2,3-dioxygenase-like lactoylglutathione lyase family enzyme
MVESVAPHGLHHLTAVAEDPQRNVDFCATVPGLRLVKRTVNFPTSISSSTRVVRNEDRDFQ